MKRVVVLGLVLIVLAMVGIVLVQYYPGSSQESSVMPDPSFMQAMVEVRGSAEGEAVIKIGAINQSSKQTKELEHFEGHWQLLNHEGEIRAEGGIYHLSSFNAEELRFPLTWQAALDPGDYTLLWGAPELGSVEVAFQVEKTDNTILILEQVQKPSDSYPPAFAD